MRFNIKASSLQRRTATSNNTLAYSFPPNQNWDGNDGGWSTFVIRVGTPPQYFRVLPSTNGLETWVPVASNCSSGTSACGNARGVEPFKNYQSNHVLSQLDVGSTCSANRSPYCGNGNCNSVNGKCQTGPCADSYCCGDDPGQCNSAGCNGVSGFCTAAYIGCPCTGPDYDTGVGVVQSPGAPNPEAQYGFLGNESSTWQSIGNFPLMEESNLGLDPTSQYGYDTVGAGPTPDSGLTITDKTVVAGITNEPFYLGTLGLKPSNSSRFNSSTPSFMTLLKDEGLIPSLSYGYTAGAIYRKYSTPSPRDLC